MLDNVLNNSTDITNPEAKQETTITEKMTDNMKLQPVLIDESRRPQTGYSLH